MNKNNKRFGEICLYCGYKLKKETHICENCGRTIVRRNDGNFEGFYINSRHYKFMVAFISIFTTPFIIMFIVSSILSVSSVDRFLLLIPIFFCLFIGFGIEFFKRKLEIYISHRNFTVLIGNNLFLHINWEDIKELTIIEEIYELKVKHPNFFQSDYIIKTGYKLEFMFFTKKESIRLWCCNLTEKQQNKIINNLKHFFGGTGKVLNTIESSGKIIRHYNAEKMCSKIRSLIIKE